MKAVSRVCEIGKKDMIKSVERNCRVLYEYRVEKYLAKSMKSLMGVV